MPFPPPPSRSFAPSLPRHALLPLFIPPFRPSLTSSTFPAPSHSRGYPPFSFPGLLITGYQFTIPNVLMGFGDHLSYQARISPASRRFVEGVPQVFDRRVNIGRPRENRASRRDSLGKYDAPFWLCFSRDTPIHPSIIIDTRRKVRDVVNALR